MGWWIRIVHAIFGPPLPSVARPAAPEEEPAETGPDGGVVVMPIEDSIDLHHFAPRDVPSVVDEYVREAHARGFSEVTIIHGRGKGIQRAKVAKVLAGHPLVADVRAAGGARALGATVATLVPGKRARRAR